ncbi:MAG: hypothetical protein WCI96_12925, partial [Planctomycetota bacterium]
MESSFARVTAGTQFEKAPYLSHSIRWNEQRASARWGIRSFEMSHKTGRRRRGRKGEGAPSGGGGGGG